MRQSGAPQTSRSKALEWSANLFVLVSFLLVSDGIALIVPSPSWAATQRRSSWLVPRQVHVATSFVQASDDSNSNEEEKLSRPERKARERAKKQRRKNGKQKKPKKIPQYKLHSKRISMLSKETSTADDVLQAIKRAQNLHDAQDLAVIAKFLLEEVDENFAFGYLGSLLSRLAVAAMHVDNHELARKALEMRRTEYRPSMRPMESAAIIRGLLRMHHVTDAIEVLDDELCLPLEVMLISSFCCDSSERLECTHILLLYRAHRWMIQRIRNS